MMAEPPRQTIEPEKNENVEDMIPKDLLKDEIPAADQNKIKEKVVIIGFENCGVLSLKDYLEHLGLDVQVNESLWRKGVGVSRALIRTQHGGAVPVFITKKGNEENLKIVTTKNYHELHYTLYKLEEMLEDKHFKKLDRFMKL